jgi:hypothetical protein
MLRFTTRLWFLLSFAAMSALAGVSCKQGDEVPAATGGKGGQSTAAGRGGSRATGGSGGTGGQSATGGIGGSTGNATVGSGGSGGSTGQGGTTGGSGGTGGSGQAGTQGGMPADTATGELDAASGTDTNSGTPRDSAGGEAVRPAGEGATGPIGAVGNTFCINADGPGGRDTYAIFDSVLGANSVENNPDTDHAFKHIQEASDAEVGNHFVYFAHYPTDNDGAPGDDRSRIEVKVNNGAAAPLKGLLGDTMTYTWRFKMPADMRFSNRFTHLFQLKSYGGNEGAPIITITPTMTSTGTNETLRVDYWPDDASSNTSQVLARVPTAGIKGVWLQVHVRAQIAQSGAFFMTIKKSDGTPVIDIDMNGLDLWRQGDYIRPKWGIYRGKSELLKQGEEQVRFSSFAITKGTNPSSDCRAR